MSLTELENTLSDLVARHPKLDVSLLGTLLDAAGWEDKMVKDAMMLFKQKYPERSYPKTAEKHTLSQNLPSAVISHRGEEISVSPVRTEQENGDMVFITENNVQEKDMNVIISEPLPSLAVRNEQHEGRGFFSLLGDFFSSLFAIFSVPSQPTSLPQTVIQQSPVVVEQQIDVEPKEKEVKEVVEEKNITPPEEVVQVKTEPVYVSVGTTNPQVSLVEEKVTQPTQREPVALPENLPIVPFENSPHVWSLSQYQDVFHKDELQAVSPSAEVQEHIPEQKVTPSSNEVSVVDVKSEEEDIVLEKTPLTKGDETLVVLASVMLFIIILILGYMYSNGRL